MADIKKLLSKKGWTGRELGIIEISNMCSVFSQRMSGVQNPVPLVTKAQFQTMLNSIQDRYQAKIYSGYMSIHEWLSLYYNVCNSHTQQAQFQFTKLADVMERAIQAEDLFQYIEGLPLIMTPQQYEDEKAKGVIGSSGLRITEITSWLLCFVRLSTTQSYSPQIPRSPTR